MHGYLAGTFTALQGLLTGPVGILLGQFLEAQHIYTNAHARIIEC